MPSSNIRQRRLMGMALRHKREGGTGSGAAARLADTMSESQLRDFASSTPRGAAKRAGRRSAKRKARRK